MNDTPGRTGRRPSAADEDRIEILKMVENGTITAEEASTLLDALDQADQLVMPAESTSRPIGRVSHVRIRVTDSKSGRPRVNVALPIGLLDVGLGVMRRFVPNADTNMGVIREALLSGAKGHMITVDQDGERVEIIAE